MAAFPKREEEVVALARKMIAGFLAYPGDFPHGDAAGLQADLDSAEEGIETESLKKGELRLATEGKLERLDRLRARMHGQLMQAKVDTGGDPDKLNLLGSGPRAKRRAAALPAQPVALEAATEGPGSVDLAWKRPRRGTGGPVRSFVAMRREKAAGASDFSAWTIVWSGYATKLRLDDQPRGMTLEYQVLASNSSGQSLPSNTVAVVL